MIYVPLQDLHLVHSMDWISQLSRRYHSVRTHILTPYGEAFLLPVGNESTYWRKGRVSHFTLFLLSFFVPCVLGPWVRGFSMRTEKRSKSDFWEAYQGGSNKSISVNQKWQSSRGLVKVDCRCSWMSCR